MEERQLAEVGTFCMNEACEDYQKIKPDNVVKYGKTEKGVQRYRCQTCKKTFTETKGTMFYRLRHSQEEVIECMAMVGDRNSLAAIHRIKGIKEETVSSWLERAEAQVKQVEEHFVAPHKLSGIQADADARLLLAIRAKKGEIRRRGKRNVLAYYCHRNRESFTHWTRNSKDRTRNRVSLDGTDKKACIRR